ncbi:sulfatase [Muriicola sp. Z0-33]|nr:sulfatase [Muriicola sp. Z0-33]
MLLITSFQLGCEEDTELPEQNLPNIIWLVAEDQSPDFFPMYGDSTISLPNLEALANEGVIFNNAYSPVPVCAPARSALITGMYPTTLGTHNMRTYNAYRTDNQPELGIPSYSPVVPQGVKMFTEYLRRSGYYCTNNPKEDYNFKKTEVAWDDSSKDAHWRNRPKNTPFFSVFNFSVCHESQIWQRGEDELLVSPDAVNVPAYFPDTKEVRHDIAVNYSNLIRLDNQIGEIIKQLREDELYDNSIIFFYGDHGGPFPRHKRALYETGVKVPLLIKFKENQKEYNSDNRFISFVDFAPTVLSMAGIEPPKVMQGRAHFGDYANAGNSDYLFFSSDRFDGMVDRIRAVRYQRYKYIKNFNPDISNALPVAYREQMPMMQQLNQLWENEELDSIQSLWFRTPKPEEELYDLEADPFEFVNLVGKEELQDTLLLLRNVLNEWITNTNDLGRHPENELLSNWLPEGKPQRLPSLELEDKEGKINLFCKQSDATIVWKQPQDSTWLIFDAPISNQKSFSAKAVRIGFKDSELLEYTVD